MTGEDEVPAAWRPALGAWPDADGFRFRVWAPERQRIDLVVRPVAGDERHVRLEKDASGCFSAAGFGIGPGARYGYLVDGEGPFPDPASRCQPDGVHGLSATVDPGRFQWSDDGWHGTPLGQAVFYELHVGTFTGAGTFAAGIDRLPYLADLGVTVIELMPVAACPGARNWGYDGVSLFAPAPAYGAPDDLRRFVDAAHALGLGVVLDVVYNHFGPDGAYGFLYSPYYASTRHSSPWGAAVNFDGDQSAHVRMFVVENAMHWLHEYHLDGLRLDATHAIADDTPRHIVTELVGRARQSLPHRTLLFVAEDDRNMPGIVRSPMEGGWGCDAVWADDFHHHVRRIAAGDAEAYYQDFSDEAGDLARTILRGWFYVGQHSAFRGEPRGADPEDVAPERMVICLQNHDQVGNRAFGERLHHEIPADVFRTLTAVLLCAPETPLLFMGQEWAASTPFLFFTDHSPELGRLVTAGRRNEFSRFSAFRDEHLRSRIPDPQAPETFQASQLVWAELEDPDHAAMLRWYRALLRLRRTDPVLDTTSGCDAAAPDARTLVVRRSAAAGTLLVVARFRGSGTVDLSPWTGGASPAAWTTLLTSDDEPFAASAGAASRARLAVAPDLSAIDFPNPAAVLLRSA